MNPEFHHEFVTLVPLFYSGELTDEEWALLQVHMAYCASCREAFEQHQHIASDVIPAMAAGAIAEFTSGPVESDQSLRQAQQQLMSRLEGQEILQRKRPDVSPWGWAVVGAAAACVVGVLAFAGLHHVHPSVQQSATRVQSSAPAQTTALKIADPGISAAHAQLVSDEQKLSALESELAEAEKKSKEFKIAAADTKHKLEGAQAQQQQTLNQTDSLNQKLAAAQSEAQSLREKLVSVQSGAGQQTMRISELQTKVQHLNAALDDANTSLESKDRMLAFDKDLMLHDRDIRNVIGARNLYIADIYDTNSNGATAKPFGRIFYTKDSSLVFYGFDLEKQSGTKQPVAFQAWGSGTDRRPVSLGLFYQDDGHKRWVLKCNDPSTLARLNMVFVTIEPPGGSNKPTGKQFLRAYLQIQANHP